MRDDEPDADLRAATLAILAGGEGSRMGGPKADLRVAGRPILAHLIERFRWPGPTLLVTAPGREKPTGSDAFTRELVDPVQGQGPLRGLLTALEHTAAPVLLVTAVDMPFVRDEHLSWLATQIRERHIAGLMTRRGGEIEPLPSAFTPAAVPHLRRRLERGRRSLHGLLDDAAFVVLDAPPDWPERTWANLNSPDDLAAAGG